MTIKTNSEGKVILKISANIDNLENGYIVESVPEVPNGKLLYYINNEFQILDDPNYAALLERYALETELAYIKAWMDEFDYYCNKIKRGNWGEDDPRWVNYLVEYDQKHARKEAIEALLKRN